MEKKLSKFGNSLALILDKPLLKLLDINEATRLKIKVENGKMTITPIKKAKKQIPVSKTKKIQKSFEAVMEKYAEAFEKLAKK